MKFTSILLTGVLSAGSVVGMTTVAHVDNTTHVVAAGTPGSVVGAGSSAAVSERNNRKESAMDGGLCSQWLHRGTQYWPAK